MIQEVHRENSAESAAISSDVIERMIRQGQFSMSKITLQLSSKLAETEISLCLSNAETYTISRFPRSLLQDEDYKRSSIPCSVSLDLSLIVLFSILETRQNLNKNSRRWASRTPSQQIRRKNWVPPDLTQNFQRLSTITRYSDSNYCLGDSSPAALGRFARLFKLGSNSIVESENRVELAVNPPRRRLSHVMSQNNNISSADYQSPLAELQDNQVYELDGYNVERFGPSLDNQTNN